MLGLGLSLRMHRVEPSLQLVLLLVSLRWFMLRLLAGLEGRGDVIWNDMEITYLGTSSYLSLPR